jgi:pimeloyl-ACP methyl ester carboxylesterase
MTDYTLTLDDGRTVVAWEGGAPDSVPILFHHGTPSGRLQARLGAAVARRLGIRLVSFNRPGYGESTDTAPGLASVGEDTLRVADALDLREFAVLGVSGGGPYALATALADPERVRAVGLAAGVGPWRLIEPPDATDPDLPLLALVDAGDVSGALEGFRAQGRAEFDQLLELADGPMIAEFFRGAPAADIEWLDEGLWAEDLRDALRSYDGYARDNVSWGGPWDIDPGALRTPVWLWYGADDRLVPPSHGTWLADRIPQATLVVHAGEGHGRTTFTHWETMFSALRASGRLGG